MTQSGPRLTHRRSATEASHSLADHRRSLWGHHGTRSGGAVTKKWSDALVERSVSSWLLDPEPSDTDDDRVALSELRNLINRELNTVGDVKGLTSDIRKWGKGRALSERLKQVFDAIIFEELEQILDDIDWASSARRKRRAQHRSSEDAALLRTPGKLEPPKEKSPAARPPAHLPRH